MWMSARLGGAFTPLLVFVCLQFVTWRTAFLLFGLLGVVWAVLFFRWYRDDPRTHAQVNAAEAALLPVEADAGDHFHAPWKMLFTSRTVWCLCGQYFACSYCFYFFITWFPTYLLKQRGFDMKQSALLAGTPLLLGACGSLFAGWMLPLLSRRWGDAAQGAARPGRSRRGGRGGPLDRRDVADGTLSGGGGHCAGGVLQRHPVAGRVDRVHGRGRQIVATLSGTMNMMGNVGGFVSPIVCGYIVQADRTLGPGVLRDGGGVRAWGFSAGWPWTRSHRSRNRRPEN